ncbi:DUF5791 family protein [Halobacterium jilantaiense]|uniref:Uncharacterized protein n=1 Tax=Halobacterium jilantaiense TaxID=355548 RepID=A0A1I0NZK4_9EURY|nr:DUF5791 family protein [Halobacterium jilantaiense]SEW07188.1 hypothetical protein SAMN04487945_1268 [Halobacterium jilantaiense]
MFTEAIADPEETTDEAVHADYEATLAAVVEAGDIDAVAAESGVDSDVLDALAAGESPELTVEEAAGILGTSDDYPAADDLLLEVQDHLMLQMSSAVMDVEALASGLDDDYDAKELQQKLEGRQPMTLAEYARIHRYVAAENPY